MIHRGPGFLAVIWFSSSPHLPPPRQQVVSLTRSSCVSPVELTEGRGGRGWGRSQIIWCREMLVLYKSFNTRWVYSPCLIWACFQNYGLAGTPITILSIQRVNLPLSNMWHVTLVQCPCKACWGWLWVEKVITSHCFHTESESDPSVYTYIDDEWTKDLFQVKVLFLSSNRKLPAWIMPNFLISSLSFP